MSADPTLSATRGEEEAGGDLPGARRRRRGRDPDNIKQIKQA